MVTDVFAVKASFTRWSEFDATTAAFISNVAPVMSTVIVPPALLMLYVLERATPGVAASIRASIVTNLARSDTPGKTVAVHVPLTCGIEPVHPDAFNVP